MIRSIAAGVLGVFMLGVGFVSAVHASKTCNPHACRAVISANCAGLSGSARAQCQKMIVGECNAGTITCAASPSGAFLE